ncbi:leucine zipper domain-containing protein [Acuticoccus sp.]|uniref:leucine zipper domain-containing protein n=1 Tax=Acuticoccus sp. TaxID=1904378 RepID=UPI003B51B2D0
MTHHGRVPSVRPVRQGGWRVAEAAEAAGISARAAYKQLARHRAEGERMLRDRSSARAHRLPHALVGLPHASRWSAA